MKPSGSNVFLESVDKNTLTLKVGEEVLSIPNDAAALKKLLEDTKAEQLQTADKIYNIGSIGTATFNIVLAGIQPEPKLPAGLADNLISSTNNWVKSLHRELLKRRVPVREEQFDIFQRYGWLIETFLLKLNTEVARAPTLRRLSFMTEAYRSSLRYLCYIQLSQLLTMDWDRTGTDFFDLDHEQCAKYDLLTLLIELTQQLEAPTTFVPELHALVEDLLEEASYLRETALFLEDRRSAFIKGEVKDDEHLPHLLDEYLTALVFWLRNISFLAKYRLVSVKDIQLNYQLGVTESFEHVYGELHCVYDKQNPEKQQVATYIAEGAYTYNNSVLLLKGSSVEQSLERIGEKGSYLSLSPLILDHSVYTVDFAQTPSIYYYAGKSGKRSFRFAKSNNELMYGEGQAEKTNRNLEVHQQNLDQPQYDELYEQLELILNPKKSGSL